MLRKCIRITFCFLGILLFLTLCTAAAVYFRYEQVKRSEEKVKLLQIPSLPENSTKIRLGDKLVFKALFSVPWGTTPLAIVAEPSEGSQLAAEPLFKKIKTGWGRDQWQGNIVIQPYRSGAVKASGGEASFSSGQVLKFAIPPFEVQTSAVQGTEPELAGKIEFTPALFSSSAGKGKIVFAVLLALALLGILFLIGIYFFLRKKERLVTPWEKALTALCELLDKVKSGQIPPERSIEKLCDILREYLEKRFALRVSRQTTGEFLASLEKNHEFLSEEQQKFLQDFLKTADMVKFAKQSASAGEICTLAARGEALIRETIPADDKSEHSGKEKKK